MGKTPTIKPAAGQIFGLALPPFCRYSPGPTNRVALVKVIETPHPKQSTAAVLVLEPVLGEMPSKVDLQTTGRMHRTASGGPSKPFVVNLHLEASPEETTPVLIESVAVDPAETALARACNDYGTWDSLARSIELEWRMRHDRPAIEAERLRLRHDFETRREREQTRLKNLTFATLLAEEPFQSWASRSEFVPAEFATRARERVGALEEELAKLGRKPRKGELRAALHACVEWFNAINEEYGMVIETDEREDICARLEEIAYAGKHPGLVDEIEDWRDW